MHLFLRKVFEKEHLLIHSWKNHRSDPPNSGASKCICGVGCVAQWLRANSLWRCRRHVEENIGKYTALLLGDLFGMVKNVTPSKGCWWPPTNPVMKKGHELNHLALFQHDFLLGGIFPWCFADGSGESFTTKVLPWRVTTWKRPCKSWARNFVGKGIVCSQIQDGGSKYDYPTTKKGNRLLEAKWMVWRSRHVLFLGWAISKGPC